MTKVQQQYTLRKYYIFLENFLIGPAESFCENHQYQYGKISEQLEKAICFHEDSAYHPDYDSGAGKASDKIASLRDQPENPNHCNLPNHLGRIIDMTTWQAKYDSSVKELLADPQILARILKGTMEEVRPYTINQIMEMIGDVEISRVRMEPGYTNRMRRLEQQEDSVPGEGSIYYDIRFTLFLPDQMMKILINIEAQKTTNPGKLGYHLDNRMIYYMSRLVSAQKEVEFAGSDYDDLKPVRSIWICMDSKDGDDSITRVGLESQSIFGNIPELPNLGKMQCIIIRLRKQENLSESKNSLIGMLEELLKEEAAEVKMKNLTSKYNMEMTYKTERSINTMCNLSEVVLERGMERGIKMGIEKGIEQGIEKGIEQGIEKGIEQGIERGIEKGIEKGKKRGFELLITQMLENGRTPEEIADFCNISLPEILEVQKLS